jgi:hypothetical protein
MRENSFPVDPEAKMRKNPAPEGEAASGNLQVTYQGVSGLPTSSPIIRG